MSTPKKYTFKLLLGTHSEGGKLYVCHKAKKDMEGNAGDIIQTDSNLAAKFNGPGVVKFALHDEQSETTTEVDANGDVNFSAMTIADLKAFAAENEIDLGPATTKADILKTIQEEWDA